MAEPTHGAVFQFEINRKRWLSVHDRDLSQELNESQMQKLHHIARTAISDTIRNGGTFVMVVSAETITMVQRPDAEDLPNA